MITTDSTRRFIAEFNVNTKIGWNKLITTYKSDIPNKSVYKVTDIIFDQDEWIISAMMHFQI